MRSMMDPRELNVTAALIYLLILSWNAYDGAASAANVAISRVPVANFIHNCNVYVHVLQQAPVAAATTVRATRIACKGSFSGSNSYSRSWKRRRHQSHLRRMATSKVSHQDHCMCVVDLDRCSTCVAEGAHEAHTPDFHRADGASSGENGGIEDQGLSRQRFLKSAAGSVLALCALSLVSCKIAFLRECS